MRAKYAREIRQGILAAKFAIGFTETIGRPPYAVPNAPKTELGRRAEHRTIVRHVAKEMLASAERITLKLEQKGWL